MRSYFSATRHPWSSFLFLLPLIAAYEGGVLWLGGDRADQLRNGADAWLRWALEAFGANHVLLVPALLILLLLVWSWWRWMDRPVDPVRTWFGMAFESGAWAFALWQFSQNFGPLVERLGITLEITIRTATAAKAVTFIGAGIYEEVIFRLGLFTLLFWFLRLVSIPLLFAVLIAAVGAALGFAAAHHIGPYGEAMNPYVFLFRAIAGLYFTMLFVSRGFGIAVGAHAGYDLLVGLTAP
jgi:hypothetical protein